MTATADLLATLKRGRTWEQVAELLGAYSPAMWMLIAKGKRHATLEQVNLVRRVHELPPLTKTPTEIIEESGVDRVIPLSRQPNTALLVALAGDLVRASLKTGVLPDDESPSISITACNTNHGRRKRHRGSRLFTMSDIAALPPKSLKTVRGNTGNIAAIREAARLAADNLTIDDFVSR